MSFSEKLKFRNRNGDTLVARLEFPEMHKPKAFVVFAHCFTCGKNLAVTRSISRSLNKEGFAVCRFDFTGLGESGGEFADSNFSSNVTDLLDTYDYIAQKYEAPKLLIGHSLGGAAVLKAAMELPEVQAIATIGAPSEPEHVEGILQSKLEEIENSGIAEVKIGPSTFKIKKQFLEDIRSENLLDKLKDLRKALLILHSPQDEIVSIDHAAKLYTHAWHPKSFVSLDGADHLLSRSNDAEYAANVISSWASRYLEYDKPEHIEAKSGVYASLAGKNGYTTEMHVGAHGFLADEPEDMGGKDLGPTPYELVSSGLAACTAMTLQMYARRKEWSLDNVHVEVKHSKTHAKDSQGCEDKKSKIDVFERIIRLEGELDEKQQSRLIEIANKCPVHKTLEGQIEIETRLL